MDLLLNISVLLAIFCWLGDVEVMKCPWKETVLGKNTIRGVWGYLTSRIAAMLTETSPPPPPMTGWIAPVRHSHCPTAIPPSPTERLNIALWPHPNSLSRYPVSQVAGCRYTLLAGELFHKSCWELGTDHFSQPSPKMLKMASKALFKLCCCF